VKPSGANYYFVSGKDLAGYMREYEKFEKIASDKNVSNMDAMKMVRGYNFFIAYILGVYDSNNTIFKVPEGLTTEQVVAIVTKYLKNHPGELNKPAYLLVLKAFQKAFPLKKLK
jgi:hypothetical protein